MTPKNPFLEGTFWDKFWRPIRFRAPLFTPENLLTHEWFYEWAYEWTHDSAHKSTHDSTYEG